MTTIETHIGNLLLRHNCVIVPSFGGFVAKQVSAKINYSSGKMTPPRKSLLFNKQLINNDGLLINELAQSNGLTFEIASNEVKQKVSEWNALLKSGNRIELDCVGFLFLDAEKNLCFEQDRFFNLLLQSFGLGQVHFLTEVDVKNAEHKINITEKSEEQIVDIDPKMEETTKVIPIRKISTIVADTTIIEHPGLVKKRSNAWKYVAAACFLPVAFYSIWIPMKTDVLESGVISMQDFNPFQQNFQEHFTVPSSIETKENTEIKREGLSSKINEISSDVVAYSYKFDEDLFVPVKVNSNATFDKEEKPTISVDVPFSANTKHYIVGCFSDKNNAEKLVVKLKSSGLLAKILDKNNGLYRVSAGGAMSTEGLNDIKMSTNSLGLAGWILN
ncbi:MAG: hypothetical protein QNL61_06040 [Crocinitomicaceae bacterium]